MMFIAHPCGQKWISIWLSPRMDGRVDEHDVRALGLQSRDGTRAAMGPDGT